MAAKAFYFLAPTRDAPPDGPIVIGNIISNRAKPDEPVNESDPPIREGKNKVFESTVKNWENDVARNSSRAIGVYAKFLQSSGIGMAANASHDIKLTDLYDVKTMTTKYFVPSQSYVQKSIEDEDVKIWMKENDGRSLWMITGIKIASGATFDVTNTRSKEHYFMAGFDLTPKGIPLSIGPKLKFTKSISSSERGEATSDFVFAYRLRKIKYDKRKGKLTHDDDTDGALYETGPCQGIVDEAIEFDVIDSVESEEEQEGILVESAVDDENGAPVTCAVPAELDL